MRLIHGLQAGMSGGRIRLLFAGLFIVLCGLPVWGGAQKAVIDLFSGIEAGPLPEEQSGWSRSEKDDADGASPDWWVKFHSPENAAPYLEICQDVWNNGPNLTVNRELRVDDGLKSWQLTGRLKFINAGEDSVFLRVLDEQHRAIASFERLTINHKQGKYGPGNSYLNFNGVAILPGMNGKIRWNAIMKFTTEDWKPFSITWSADTPGVVTLIYGDRTVEAPVRNGVHAESPKDMQIFFGWGLSAQGDGSILLEGLTIATERATEKTSRW